MTRRLRRHSAGLLLLPGALLLIGLFAWPVAELMGASFGDAADPLAHYRRMYTEPTYLRVVGRTLFLSAVTVAICLVLGYPLAYQLNRARRLGKALILLCIFIPFWTNLLVRSYGWIVLLNPQGVINALLQRMGLIEAPLGLVYNTTGVLIGMTQIMLPYMVLPLAAVMGRIDQAVMNAARSLGAPPAAAFLRVYIPLTLPGALAGCVLVFTISLGFFVVPALLGGSREILLAQLIEFNINTTLNWGFAAALSTVLLAATLALYWIGDRFFNLGQLWGAR